MSNSKEIKSTKWKAGILVRGKYYHAFKRPKKHLLSKKNIESFCQNIQMSDCHLLKRDRNQLDSLSCQQTENNFWLCTFAHGICLMNGLKNKFIKFIIRANNYKSHALHWIYILFNLL